jgi:2-methylisocitrate lyase-like PEP mutase family enzyme
MSSQTEKAASLRQLGTYGIYVLANVWDAGSAVLTARAGAKVIATTSAGVSWALGSGDGEHLTREENIGVIRRISAAVELPVSADIESGYGPTPDDVAQTVRDVIAAGAVGVNLEDSDSATGEPFTVHEQAARIRAARAAATEAGLPELVINARTDVYLFQIGEPAGRFEDVINRAQAYADAGADILFVPGLLDLAVIRQLVSASPLPINIMAGPGAPTIRQLADAGVRRVSLGSAIAQAAYGAALSAARETLQDGTYEIVSAGADFGEINGAF